MRATKEYVERKFNEYNAMCFEGKLQPLPIVMSRARSFLGQVGFVRKRNLNGTWHYYNFVFRISIVLDQEESIIEDTILHEMIHYYILSNQMQDTAPHGKIFRTIMNNLNKRFDRHISISHKKTEAEKNSDKQIRRHLICIVDFKDGTTGVCFAAQTRLFEFWKKIPKSVGVKQCTWYISTNPYFNRYSRSITPKVYRIPDTELKYQMRDARRLVKEGNTIHVASNLE